MKPDCELMNVYFFCGVANHSAAMVHTKSTRSGRDKERVEKYFIETRFSLFENSSVYLQSAYIWWNEFFFFDFSKWLHVLSELFYSFELAAWTDPPFNFSQPLICMVWYTKQINVSAKFLFARKEREREREWEC